LAGVSKTIATAFRVLYWWRQQCKQISNGRLEIFNKIFTLLTVTVLFLFTFFNLILDVPRRYLVPEFLDPVFAKTSPKRSFSMTENSVLGFCETGSINLGIDQHQHRPLDKSRYRAQCFFSLKVKNSIPRNWDRQRSTKIAMEGKIFAFGFSKKYDLALLLIEGRVLDRCRAFDRFVRVDAHLCQWGTPPSK
jgi:hypothetical protein